ncbi:hypothetical protein PFISCL1PPCAC_7910, partial [Pristionchus fissidentatus]
AKSHPLLDTLYKAEVVHCSLSKNTMRRILLLALPLLGLTLAAKEGSPLDPSFAEALVRLCELSPTHSLCARVQILDHIPEGAQPMVMKQHRRKAKATTVAPTTTTDIPSTTERRVHKYVNDEQEEKSREFFRSISDEIAVDYERKKPANARENVNSKSVSTPLRIASSSFSRFQREPPAAPPVQATTPSLWDWMNKSTDKEGYLFEDSEETRNEIFKKRWLRKLRARKARRRVAAVKTDTRETGPLAALGE